MTSEKERRQFLQQAAAVAGVLLSSGALAADGPPAATGAVEDLMREHGVLRRALLVYRAYAQRLRVEPAGSVPAEPLQKTAQLMRTFGENYHERKLEEGLLFPVLRRLPGPIAAYPATLTAQHNRGREITDYVLASTKAGRIGAGQVQALTRALETFSLMYEQHAAREDTVVFPAWQAALANDRSGKDRLAEMAQQFETIERAEFGQHGFADAVATIADIERSLGLSDLAQFTAPPPPQQT
jgi:hemerythrin-like domain-containing protein